MRLGRQGARSTRERQPDTRALLAQWQSLASVDLAGRDVQFLFQFLLWVNPVNSRLVQFPGFPGLSDAANAEICSILGLAWAR